LEFEFRVGKYNGQKFIPGVSTQEFNSILNSLSRHNKYLTENSSVLLYSDGYREIRSSSGVIKQLKKNITTPLYIENIGRFNLSSEKIIQVFPTNVSLVDTRERIRYIFSFQYYNIEM